MPAVPKSQESPKLPRGQKRITTYFQLVDQVQPKPTALASSKVKSTSAATKSKTATPLSQLKAKSPYAHDNRLLSPTFSPNAVQINSPAMRKRSPIPTPDRVALRIQTIHNIMNKTLPSRRPKVSLLDSLNIGNTPPRKVQRRSG